MFDKTLQGTGLSAVNFDGDTFLIYQTSDASLHRIVEGGGEVTYEDFDFSPILGSPLASVSWEGGGLKDFRLYYLDNTYNIKEYCCTKQSNGKTTWYHGNLRLSNVRANPSAGLSAIVYLDDKDSGVHLRVYYQDLDTLKITQLGVDDAKTWWYEDPLIVAVGGTGIAAVTYPISDDNHGIRYYYQDQEVKLKERVFDGTNWFDGDFAPGQVTVRGPISADIKSSDDAGNTKEFIYVYWRKLDTTTVFGIKGIDSVGTDSSDDPATVEPIGDDVLVPSVFQQAALVVNGQLRFYYQDKDGQLGYYYSNNNGDDWYPMGTN